MFTKVNTTAASSHPGVFVIRKRVHNRADVVIQPTAFTEFKLITRPGLDRVAMETYQKSDAYSKDGRMIVAQRLGVEKVGRRGWSNSICTASGRHLLN